MHDNHGYNLMHQMVQEHKSLWRITKMYGKDAKKCKSCLAFWKKMEKDKRGHIQELKKLLKTHGI